MFEFRFEDGPGVMGCNLGIARVGLEAQVGATHMQMHRCYAGLSTTAYASRQGYTADHGIHVVVGVLSARSKWPFSSPCR